MINKQITIENVDNYLLFKAIVGSHAYGLNTPTSDIDTRGIFLLPNENLLTSNYVEQVNDEKNDTTIYELNRFIHLLKNNNPNIIELLFSDNDKILHCDERLKPLLDNKERFLTKKIKETFGGYALSQIGKARGLNKKFMNPMDEKKKTPIDFCYIFEKEDGYMMLTEQWLKKKNFKQENIGLSQLPNGPELYKVYYDWLSEVKNDNPRYSKIETHGFKGMVDENSNQLKHSEIPKGFQLEAFLWFNKDGYSVYCKEYKEYFDWVKNRNEDRYNDNLKNNQGYDGKNMMHCLRILDMGIEIGEGKGVKLLRDDRDFLLSVRKGSIKYGEILELIENKKQKLEEVYSKCDLPESVDEDFINEIILKIRN